MNRWAGLLVAIIVALAWLSGESFAGVAAATLEIGAVLALFCAVCATEALS
jgi:hypothetical protein